MHAAASSCAVSPPCTSPSKACRKRASFGRRAQHRLRQQAQRLRRQGPRIEQAAELLGLEGHGQQFHAARTLQGEVLAGAQQEQAVVLERAALHARNARALAIADREAQPSRRQAALLHDALAHPLAEHVHPARHGFGQRAAHHALRQLQVALLPLGRGSTMQVEVVVQVEGDGHASARGGGTPAYAGPRILPIWVNERSASRRTLPASSHRAAP